MPPHISPRVVTASTPPAISPHHHVSTHRHAFYTQDPLGIPLGKYYPSNYKYLVSTTVTPVSDQFRPLSPMDLEISFRHKKRTTKMKLLQKPHEQKTSEVSIKLKQYQREMIAQTRNAAKERSLNARKLPERVRLHPTEADYDRITPFELGGAETSGGYITEGERIMFERQGAVANSRSKNGDYKLDGLMKIISPT